MNRRTRIKICGLRDPEMVAAAVQAGADAVGFVFYPPSVRDPLQSKRPCSNWNVWHFITCHVSVTTV
jgi:phosphoribosylanthranilate isomerase